MFYSLFCHVDIDDNFDDSYDDEEAFVNEEDESWYTKDKMVKTKVYRWVPTKEWFIHCESLLHREFCKISCGSFVIYHQFLTQKLGKFPLTSSNLIWVEYCTLFPIQFSFVKPNLFVLLPILVFGNFETRTQFWQMLSIIAKYFWYFCLDHMARISCLRSRRRGWSRCAARPWPTSCSPTPSSWSCSSSSPTPTETPTPSRSRTI